MRHVIAFAFAMTVCASSTLAVIQIASFYHEHLWLAAIGEAPTTIDFSGLPVGTNLTDQYGGLGVSFTDGSDTVEENALYYPIDGRGVNAHGSTTLVFDSPKTAVGANYFGGLRCDFYDGPVLLGSSVEFGGSGVNGFGGVIVSKRFDRVVLHDWRDGHANFDDMQFIPEPGAILILAIGGLTLLCRSHRTALRSSLPVGY
jgi:hypothetical protein